MKSADNADNMVSASHGTLSASGNNGSVLDTISSASSTQSWSLDTLGNMASVTTSGTAQSRSHNSRNQITALASATTPAYDSNGNMTTDQNGQQYVYDAWNRMMVAKNSSGSTINQYAYDGQNRQILNSSVYRYFSTMGQNLQSGTTAESLNQYQEVYNPFFIDGVMEVDTATATPGTYNQRVYGQWNANWDMTSITDTTGTAVERYEIDPYGKVAILTGSWGSRSDSSYGWTYFHQGMRLDTATGLYQGRARDYGPSLDRWMQEDPISVQRYLAGATRIVARQPSPQYNMGGSTAYCYLRDNPARFVDPLGTCECDFSGLPTALSGSPCDKAHDGDTFVLLHQGTCIPDRNPLLPPVPCAGSCIAIIRYTCESALPDILPADGNVDPVYQWVPRTLWWLSNCNPCPPPPEPGPVFA
jgi:RHS repeat-associated protein